MDNNEFGKALKNLRVMKGLTQKELLDELSVEGTVLARTSTVSKWEKGDSVPDFETIENLEIVLGVQTGSLLFKAGYKMFDTDSLAKHSITGTKITDNEMLALMSQVFDRPAFKSTFAHPRPAPDFRKAISDTIEALNTGLRRTRDGHEIGRIPSRHELKDGKYRMVLGDIVNKLSLIRSTFDKYIATGVFTLTKRFNEDYLDYPPEDEANEIVELMDEILDNFRKIYPPFDVKTSKN
jgi:transcriptional regulator with XRE-family HTH domain